MLDLFLMFGPLIEMGPTYTYIYIYICKTTVIISAYKIKGKT